MRALDGDILALQECLYGGQSLSKEEVEDELGSHMDAEYKVVASEYDGRDTDGLCLAVKRGIGIEILAHDTIGNRNHLSILEKDGEKIAIFNVHFMNNSHPNTTVNYISRIKNDSSVLGVGGLDDIPIFVVGDFNINGQNHIRKELVENALGAGSDLDPIRLGSRSATTGNDRLLLNDLSIGNNWFIVDDTYRGFDPGDTELHFPQSNLATNNSGIAQTKFEKDGRNHRPMVLDFNWPGLQPEVDETGGLHAVCETNDDCNAGLECRRRSVESNKVCSATSNTNSRNRLGSGNGRGGQAGNQR